MPEDKFHHPFFYATKLTAGVSGKGSGFFWQQNNDIFKDSDAGMVRIGKEYDDVQVISTTTGEWEFPYDVADYYALEVDMGHASGGETHGCEAAHYIANVTINETPPRFYFQKEMWHGGSKIEHESGKFTDPRVIEKVVGNGFKGFAVVRYNKKDGRSVGHDSVILEIWWNEDPDANTKNWFMVKRIEDKGGWGSGGETCDGVSDQVFTWSNIQFRYKSGTPEFSIHPIIPEFENGSNIHSIDEADMSFSDSENRGYGKDPRMPRDIEMKAIFKFASNNGIARLKNLTLREIDPSKSFEDDPTNPDPTEQPQETTEIVVFYKFQQDINQARGQSACAGTGGGGGAGGLSKFYSIAADSDKELSNSSTFQNRTRIVEEVVSSTSIFYGKTVKQIDIPLKKVGTPGASPVVNIKIWSSSDAVIYTSTTSLDPSTLTTSYVMKTFDMSSNTHVMTTGDRIGIEYTGTSSANYVIASYVGSNTMVSTDYRQYEGGAYQTKTRELAMDVWE